MTAGESGAGCQPRICGTFKKSNVDGVEEKSGRGTHDLAAWSATVMSNMLFFLSSGMVRECGYPQARHCAREEWGSTLSVAASEFGPFANFLLSVETVRTFGRPFRVLAFCLAEFAVKFS